MRPLADSSRTMEASYRAGAQALRDLLDVYLPPMSHSKRRAEDRCDVERDHIAEYGSNVW